MGAGAGVPVLQTQFSFRSPMTSAEARMRTAIQKNHLHISNAIDKAIQQKIEKIETRLKRYHPEVADLDIRLDFSEKQSEYLCSLNLKIFKDSLQAKKTAPDLRQAVDRSFETMMRELEHYRSKINKSLQPSG